MNNTKKTPTDQVKLGMLIASIWENDSGNGTFFNVTFQRCYRDRDNWKYSDSFNRDDLLQLAKLADLAHTRIYELQASRK